MLYNSVADEDVSLGAGSILLMIAKPVYKVCWFNPDDFEGPETHSMEVLFEGMETRRFLIPVHSPTTPGSTMAEGMKPLCRVTHLDCDGWFTTRVEGSRTYIEALIATAETLGAQLVAY